MVVFLRNVMQLRHNEQVKQQVKLVPVALFLMGTLLWAAACSAGAAPAGTANRRITVSAASSLKDVFSQLGRDFEGRHPGVEVDFNFAASGDLRQQIASGAPVDVFASASTGEMDDLSRQGLIVDGTLIEPVTNSVVLVVPAPAGAGIASFEDLAGGGVARIAVGDPDTVPAGRYARDTLTYFKLWDRLQAKLVFGGNVRQVLDYVARGEVDAGIVYATDARLRSGEVRTVAAAPAASHAPVVYPMAAVKGTGDEDLARQFLGYVASPDARPIFDKYGFGAAP